MSIQAETFELQDDLLPGRVPGAGEEWFILHVMSRQEKVLAGMLEGMGVRSYLPLMDRVTYHGKRKARVESPLFPGYMFLWGTHEQAYLADRTRKVANLIRVSDQATLEWELANIHRALKTDAKLEPVPALKEGQRVRVKAGPLKDVEGVVKRYSKEDYLVLQVAMLGSAARLEIERSLLVPLD